jgi:PilZ domain
MTINSHARRFRTDSLEMPLQDPTITHQLFQLITEMSEDEKRILLRLLKRGTLKSKCRRKHFRKPVHIPVRYTNQDGLSNGVIRDISLGGLFILSRKAFSLGQSLSLSFSPANFDKTLWIAGDVMRVTPEGIGVRFRSMNEIQKTAVLSIASRP